MSSGQVGRMQRQDDGSARGGSVIDPDGVLARDPRDRRIEAGMADQARRIESCSSVCQLA